MRAWSTITSRQPVRCPSCMILACQITLCMQRAGLQVFFETKVTVDLQAFADQVEFMGEVCRASGRLPDRSVQCWPSA